MRILVMVGGWIVLAGAAWAQSCPPAGARIPERSLTVSVNSVDTIYSNEHDKAGLSRLAGGTPIYAGLFHTGLTRSRVEAAVIPQLWMVDLGGGKHCFGLGRVEASWRIAELLIDIARDYRPGGCNYRVVRDHEDEHAGFTREFHRQWAPRIESVLRAEIARMEPEITTDDMKLVAQRTTDRLMAAIGPTVETFKAELRTRNAAIDTIANYRLVNGRCTGW